MRALPLLCVLLPVLNSFSGEIYRDPKTGIHILQDHLELPAAGEWYLSDASIHSEKLGYGYLEAPEAHYERAFGERTRALQERKQLLQRKRLFWNIRHALGWGERGEDLRSPRDIQALDFKHSSDAKEAFENGVIALLPDVPLRAEKADEEEILMVELKPQLNDGKHFLYSNHGGLERAAIDAEKMASWGLTVIPPPDVQINETVLYTFNIRLRDTDQKAVTVRLLNDITGEEKEITVPVKGETDDRSGFEEWAEYRAYSWGSEHSRLTGMWDRRVKSLYGLEEFDADLWAPLNDRNRQASLMGVLGGDAAIRETLQMQNLSGEIDVKGNTLIPLEDVTGVTVKAHNYKELLGEAPGGRMPMAEYCPVDRLFVGFPNPEGILQLLDGSGNVLGRFSGSRSDLILDHRILEKHLAKLGLTEAQLRRILQSGFVGKTAVLLPDLFLREGTDVTTLTRIRNLEALKPVLMGMGLDTGSGIHRLPLPSGGEAFLTLQKDLLIFSSSAEEIEQILPVIAGEAPSLGQSAEFRYMLTQNGPTAHTAAFVYLSDPFIRRLTGPGLKIAQMRRLSAKAELEKLSAGDLLYRMDHRSSAPDLQTLVKQGYAPEPMRLEVVAWEDGKATDAEWGTAGNLRSLTRRIPAFVTEQEKKAYDQYREQYERFWRQFFDPIAVRVDLKPEQEVETTVFILPLINSSIYDTVRLFFRNQEGSPALRRPVIDPAPVAMMSLNLSEDMWIDFIEGVSEGVEDEFGVNLPIWEQLGPGLHFGLADSSSVITFGSGELMNLFGAGSNLRGNEMLMVPLFGSLLTRPVVVAVDLQDPEAARLALRGMMTGDLMQEDGWIELNVSLVEISGKDKWLLRIAVGDVLFFTLSMEIQDRYLVFSNLPLNYHPAVTGSEQLRVRDASLLLQPGAIDETGPGFEASALDVARKQAHAGLEVLNAYHMAGVSSLEEALSTSRRLFGYVPVHPSPGEYIWTENGPESTVFGSRWDSRQPPLDQVDTDGLLPATEKVEVSMQLENEGLRTRVLWKGKEEGRKDKE